MVMMVVAIGTTPAGLVACCRFLSFVDFFVVVVVFAVVVFINSFQCVEHTHLTTHFHSTAPVKHFLLFDKAAAAAAAVFVLCAGAMQNRFQWWRNHPLMMMMVMLQEHWRADD